jgi:cellulose biosynthesis protein BcsQ
VKRSTRFADSTLAGQPMLDFDTRHVGSQVYRDLAAEVLRVV